MRVYSIKEIFQDNENVAVTQSQFHLADTNLISHKHEYIEIAYIRSGVGYHILNDEKQKVCEGDIFFIGRNSFHAYEKETNDFSWVNVLFLPSAIDKSVFTLANADNTFRSSFAGIAGDKTISEIGGIALYNHKTEFGSIVADMLTEYNAKHDGYQDVLRHYLQILLMKIFRLQPQINPSVGMYINNIIEYLHSHSLNNKIDVSAIARTAFLSPRSFRDMFKKTTGKTFQAYLTELRITRAKDLLENTDLSVLAVMNEVGYNDSKFFYQLFERHIGMPPGAWRKKHTPRQSSTIE